MNTIPDIEQSLGYTEADEAVLKKVKLVWSKLQTLKKKAARDPKAVREYRDLLEKGLEQVRFMKPLEEDDIQRAIKDYWAWYTEECQRLGVFEKETIRLPRSHQEWSEKWLPKEWAVFVAGIVEMTAEPSKRSIAGARVAATTLLRAYIAATPDR